MAADTAPARAAGPALEPGSLEDVAGLVVDEITGRRVTGHLQLGPEHHTPWGTDESGRLIAHGEVRLQNVTGS